MKTGYWAIWLLSVASSAAAQSRPAAVTELAPSAFAQLAPSATRYYIYDVGVISVGDDWVFRLNQSGQVVWNASGHAYVYQNCQSRDLGHLGGGHSVASAINNNGVVVGKSQQASGRWRAFSYAYGQMHDLGGSTDPNIYEAATAINFWGDIVGVESVVGTLAPTAVRYQNGGTSRMAWVTLNSPAGQSPVMNVVDLNDSQDVVGTITTGSSVLAFRSMNFGSLWAPVSGMAGLEFATFPRAMNRYGHIAGIAGNGYVRAFISKDPTVPAVDLGTLGGSLSAGMGINNYDWVVGWAEQTDGGGPRAFVHDGTQMVDLNSALWNGGGWLLREAIAINDAGQIVGEGTWNGQYHAFLLQPMARPPLFNPCTIITFPFEQIQAAPAVGLSLQH